MKKVIKTRIKLIVMLIAIATILIVCNRQADAQVTVSPFLTGGVSDKDFRPTIGTEIHVIDGYFGVGTLVGWSPLLHNGIIENAMTFGMIGYYNPLAYPRTLPYLAFKIITYGKSDPSEVTGLAKKSGIIITGLNVFPFKNYSCKGHSDLSRLNFHFGLGIDIKENKGTYLYGEFGVKYAFCIYD